MRFGPALAFAGGLLAAALGGWLFALAHVPLPWILGAMVASAVWTNTVGAGGRTRYVRRIGQLIVGAATGAVLSPAVLGDMLGLLPAMLAAALIANLGAVLLAIPLARLAGVDRLTALLSTIPAGMSEMASLAREVRARVEVVTVVRTIRVVLVVGVIPFLFGFSGDVASTLVTEGSTLAATAACVVTGALLAFAGGRVGMLNPWVVMPMVAGVGLVAIDLPLAPMPAPLLVAAQICIGFSLGARLRREDFARAPRAAAAGLVSGSVLVGAMIFGAAPVFAAWTGLDRASLALALAPGGIGEMIASAKALGAGAALVAGFQFTRSFLTNLVAPALILRLVRPSDKNDPPDARP